MKVEDVKFKGESAKFKVESLKFRVEMRMVSKVKSLKLKYCLDYIIATVNDLRCYLVM